MTENTTDFFDGIGGGGGAPGAILKTVGDFVQGEIVEMFKREYIPFGKTEPEKREDGSPKQQLVIILQTEHRNWQNVTKVPLVDPKDESKGPKPPSEDDGKRAIYVPEQKNIQFAIADAVVAARAKPVVGGTLGVKVVELRDTGKGNPLKVHKAIYSPPSASDAFFGGAPAAAPAPEAAPAAPAAPAPAAPAAAPAPAAPASQDPWATSAPATSGAPPF